MIITRTPFRISFFGGGTDYPDWYNENGEGAVISTTIDKYCYVSCRHLPPFFDHNYRIVYSNIENVKTIDEIQHPSVRAVLQWSNVTSGLEIHHDGDLPARSGLGSSSSFTVGLVNALKALTGNMISKSDLANSAIHIEQRLLGEYVGSQDQIAAAYGGFNYISFSCGHKFSVSPMIISHNLKHELQSSLLLFFTGFSRMANEIAKTKIQNFKNKEFEMREILGFVNEALSLFSDSKFSLNDFGKLLHMTWQRKRSLSDKVSTNYIDNIYEVALKSGALGGKLLGAGGGGFILFVANPSSHDRIKENLKNLIHVNFNFEDLGSRVVLYQPNGL